MANELFEQTKTREWELQIRQKDGRSSEGCKEAEVGTMMGFEILKEMLNWRDLTILYIIWCTRVHISSLLAIPLSLLICRSQSRVPYYVNKGTRQMVPQSNEFIWGEGFNYGWVGPAVFWVQQTSQTLRDWQNPRCSSPGTFKKSLSHLQGSWSWELNLLCKFLKMHAGPDSSPVTGSGNPGRVWRAWSKTLLNLGYYCQFNGQFLKPGDQGPKWKIQSLCNP